MTLDTLRGYKQRLSKQLGRELPYQIKRARHARRLPALAPNDAAIVAGIERDGIYRTSLDALGLPGSAELLRAADALLPSMPKQASTELGRHYAIDVHSQRVAYDRVAGEQPVIFTWGLHDRLLDIAENYIGLPPAMIGADVRQDVAGPNVGSRRWHVDGEDKRELKIIVHITDVTEDSVAFEYVPRSGGIGDKSLYTDEEMRVLVPESQWARCLGPRGTVAFCSTSSTFHRGHAPEGCAPRVALFFTYTSRQPWQLQDCKEHNSKSAIDMVAASLAPRQREALSWY